MGESDSNEVIAGEELWKRRLGAAQERVAAAKETLDDAMATRDALIQKADELGWNVSQMARWTALSRPRVMEIIAGRRRAA
jgi:predicted ATPase